MPNEQYTEKVSVNMNSSTLSSIDLLVDNGYFSNRSDFINYAVRAVLDKQQSTLDRIIDKNTDVSGDNPNHWTLGVCHYSAADIERLHSRGKPVTITVYGVLGLDHDIDEEKLFETVTAIRVRGKCFAAESIKRHYGLK